MTKSVRAENDSGWLTNDVYLHIAAVFAWSGPDSYCHLLSRQLYNSKFHRKQEKNISYTIPPL